MSNMIYKRPVNDSHHYQSMISTVTDDFKSMQEGFDPKPHESSFTCSINFFLAKCILMQV